MIAWKGYHKGINLGGWFSQCDYSKERFESFITETDFSRIAEWGMDHVRVPVDYNLVETEQGDYVEEGFSYLQRTVEWCEKYGLNMILDLHKTAGYSFDLHEGEVGFFESASLQERFYRLWEQFAKRFGSYPFIAFELLNEVTHPSYCETWNRIADTCITRIRAFAPDTKIMVGGYWNNSVSAVKDIRLSDYTNIVLNFHCYEPFIFTHQTAGWLPQFPRDYHLEFPGTKEEYADGIAKYWPDMLQGFLNAMGDRKMVDSEYFKALFAEAVSYAEEKQIPLYCGEYGVINAADAESTLRWYQTIHPVLEQYGIGRAAWNYKQMDFGFDSEHLRTVWEELKKYL